LARSTSFLYALHGATVLFLSFDLSRYWSLITFLAAIALVHGAVMLGIDLAEGMPLWWTVVEGPGIFATGAVGLSLQRLRGAGVVEARHGLRADRFLAEGLPKAHPGQGRACRRCSPLPRPGGRRLLSFASPSGPRPTSTPLIPCPGLTAGRTCAAYPWSRAS